MSKLRGRFFQGNGFCNVIPIGQVTILLLDFTSEETTSWFEEIRVVSPRYSASDFSGFVNFVKLPAPAEFSMELGVPQSKSGVSLGERDATISFSLSDSSSEGRGINVRYLSPKRKWNTRTIFLAFHLAR